MLHQNPVSFIQPHLYTYVLGVSIPYPMTNFPKQSSSFYTTNSLSLASNPVTELFYCPQCSAASLPLSFVFLGYTLVTLYIVLNVYPSWPPLDFTRSGLSCFVLFLCINIHSHLVPSCQIQRIPETVWNLNVWQLKNKFTCYKGLKNKI